MQITVGIITISDRASGGQYEDLGGPAVKAAADKRGWDVLAEAIVPDDRLQPCAAERLHRTSRDHPWSAQLGPASGQTNGLSLPDALLARLR